MNQFILQSQLGKENIVQTPSSRNIGCERGYQRDVWLCEVYMSQKAWNEERSFLGKNTWWLGGTKYAVNIVFPCMWSGQPLREETGNCLTRCNGIALKLDRVFSLGKPSLLKRITVWNKNQWSFNVHHVRCKQYQFGSVLFSKCKCEVTPRQQALDVSLPAL